MASVQYVIVAQFIADTVGKTGLADVTCDIDEYDVDGGSVSIVFATDSAMTETRNGQYRLFFTGDDDKLYVGTAKTANADVDQQHVAAIVVQLHLINTSAQATALSTHDGKLDTVDGIVDDILVDTGTTLPAQITAHDGKLDTVDSNVDAILVDTGTTIPDLITALEDLSAAEVWTYAVRTLTSQSNNLTIVSIVSGNTINMRSADTLAFTITDSGLALDGYAVAEFGVKTSTAKTDDESTILLRSDTHLVRVNAETPVSASNGSLTFDNTSFTVLVAIDEMANVLPGRDLEWWLKMFKTSTTPDQGHTVVSGTCNIDPAGIKTLS